MTTKLLNFYDFAPVFAASRTRAKSFARGAAGASFSCAAGHHIPRLRAPLECRWHIDPMTGALLARWVCPSANDGAGADVEPENDEARQCRYRPLRVAGGSAAARSAA
jgi:hypothetical protein